LLPAAADLFPESGSPGGRRLMDNDCDDPEWNGKKIKSCQDPSDLSSDSTDIKYSPCEYWCEKGRCPKGYGDVGETKNVDYGGFWGKNRPGHNGCAANACAYVCTACSPGYYDQEGKGTALQSCKKCDAGKSSEAKETACDECDPGYSTFDHCPEGLDTCGNIDKLVEFDEADLSPEGGKLCRECPPGRYTTDNPISKTKIPWFESGSRGFMRCSSCADFFENEGGDHKDMHHITELFYDGTVPYYKTKDVCTRCPDGEAANAAILLPEGGTLANTLCIRCVNGTYVRERSELLLPCRCQLPFHAPPPPPPDLTL
jgi:hypothetical protein